MMRLFFPAHGTETLNKLPVSTFTPDTEGDGIVGPFDKAKGQNSALPHKEFPER